MFSQKTDPSLKGQYIEKRLTEKVPQTMHSIEFMEFFSYLENCSVFGRKCQVANLVKSDVGFFFRVTRLFFFLCPTRFWIDPTFFSICDLGFFSSPFTLMQEGYGPVFI